MIYLTYADLLYVGQRALGGDMPVRDQGLLESALARPRASALERDAYGSLNEKAAALTRSFARTHGVIDGNKRLSLAALITFHGMNGRRLTWSNDEAHEFIMDVASGRLDDVSDIAKRIDLGSDER